MQISGSTWNLLENKSSWQPTGGIDAKGKGIMDTYLWTESHAPLSEVTCMKVTDDIVTVEQKDASLSQKMADDGPLTEAVGEYGGAAVSVTGSAHKHHSETELISQNGGEIITTVLNMVAEGSGSGHEGGKSCRLPRSNVWDALSSMATMALNRRSMDDKKCEFSIRPGALQ